MSSERKSPEGVREGARLGPSERVRSREEFGRLYKGGRRGGDQVLRVIVASNGLGWSRIGSAVPKRFGKAVRRNRLRRLYREAFRLEKEGLPRGYDVVVSPARGATSPTLEQVRQSLLHCFTRVARRLERAREVEPTPGSGS